MATVLTRREAIGVGAGCVFSALAHLSLAGDADTPKPPTVRFGVSTDLHIGKAVNGERKLREYVEAMKQWKPDFLVDLGDFACPSVYGRPRKYPEAHDDQLQRLRQCWATLGEVPCPVYIAMGNHCVGWIGGGQERIVPADLQAGPHEGEDITKEEFLAVTKMPGRYYSFDQGGYHFIVLDANNSIAAELNSQEAEKVKSRDGGRGEYYIDAAQQAWLAKDLEAHRDQGKIVFCHQELLWTPKLPPPDANETAAPAPPPERSGSDIANGWQIRELFRNDGHVLACFQGHQHASGWILRDGTCYITLGELGRVLARTGDGPTYSKVTLSGNTLRVEGVGKQRSYEIPLGAKSASPQAAPVPQ